MKNKKVSQIKKCIKNGIPVAVISAGALAGAVFIAGCDNDNVRTPGIVLSSKDIMKMGKESESSKVEKKDDFDKEQTKRVILSGVVPSLEDRMEMKKKSEISKVEKKDDSDKEQIKTDK